MAKAFYVISVLSFLLLSACTKEVQVTYIPKKTAIPYVPSKGYEWPVPSHWIQSKAGTLQNAKFLIGDTSPQASFSIVRLEGDSGSLLANINRWRRQLFLEPITDLDLSDQVDELILNKKRYYITKQVNQKATLAAIYKPSLDVTWFFKLEGYDSQIRPETDHFLNFLKTVNVQDYKND